jgi:hypothetical protein
MAKAKAKTGTGRNSAERDALAGELAELIPQLDEAGLAFLVEQARIHRYNMKVEALNQTVIRSRERAAKAAAGKTPARGSGSGGSGAAKAGAEGFSEIKASESGSSYYLVYKTEWIMFSKEEMLLLVQIAGGPGTELEIKERLYHWLARERSDLLRSTGMADKFDPKLTSLAKLLKKTFRVRKGKRKDP